VKPTLPPFGTRVVGIRTDGARLIIYRRRMPRGGWVWARHYHKSNISPSDIVRWGEWSAA